MVRLHVALRDRLVTMDAGSGWRADERLPDRALECVAVHPEAPDRVFCGTFESGLRRSTDGGASWERIGPADMPDAVMSIAVHPEEPDRVWAGTEPSRLYRTTDGGETWSEVTGITERPSADEWSFPPRPHTHHVRWIEFDPNDPDRVYVGIEAGALLYTPDRGETWVERPEGARRDNHQLATHPDAPGRVYSAAGDGYAESDTAGETWAHPQDGLDHRYVWSVTPLPDDPDTVLVSSATGAGRAHRTPGAESYVYRRSGDGPWTRVTDGLPTGEGVLRAVLAPDDVSGTVYAANNHGVFRTTDGGLTWHTVLNWFEDHGDKTVRGLSVTP